MAANTTETLTEIAATQRDLATGQAAIITTLGTQSQMLRVITEQLGVIIEKLTPEAGGGPTLQELLAELVARTGDNGVLLRRIDRRTESMAKDLPDDVVRAIKRASGANGNEAAGHGADGHANP